MVSRPAPAAVAAELPVSTLKAPHFPAQNPVADRFRDAISSLHPKTRRSRRRPVFSSAHENQSGPGILSTLPVLAALLAGGDSSRIPRDAYGLHGWPLGCELARHRPWPYPVALALQSLRLQRARSHPKTAHHRGSAGNRLRHGHAHRTRDALGYGHAVGHHATEGRTTHGVFDPTTGA